MDELILPLDAFVRSVGINKSTPHLLFLGAGASVSSGVPSAERCIWEWKRRIFLTRNPGLEEQFSEKVRQARPHIGYRLLCHLAQMDMVRAVWTTNFDGLPVRP